MLTCPINHSDELDHATNAHIAECYAAYEIYYDPSGLVSESEFDEMPIEQKLADLNATFGTDDAQDYCAVCEENPATVPADAPENPIGEPICQVCCDSDSADEIRAEIDRNA